MDSMQIGMTFLQALFDAFLAGVMLLATVLPACCMMLMRARMNADPVIMRHLGIVVTHARAFDSAGPVIGEYAEAPIYSEVVFKGMQYRYDRVAPRSYSKAIGANELFLVPGIVYRAVD